MTDYEIDLESAMRSTGALAIEVCDMLERFPRLNTPHAQSEFSGEFLALNRALGVARAALLDFEQSIRERRAA